jgi:hypothetical protein
MERFQRFNNNARVALAGLCSAVAVLVWDAATRALGDRRVLGGVAAVLFVSLLALLGSYLLESTVERSKRLRRWIAEDDFIEGWWIDQSKDLTSGCYTHAALLQITFREGAFVVTGSSYLPSGDRLSTWSSVACGYGGRTLYVVYEAETDAVGGGFERGLVRMQFDAPPTSYSGYLKDFTGQITRSIRGQKIGDDDLAQHNELKTMADRINLLQDKVPGWNKRGNARGA